MEGPLYRKTLTLEERQIGLVIVQLGRKGNSGLEGILAQLWGDESPEEKAGAGGNRM